MSEYSVTVFWERGGQDFVNDRYSREHLWQFDGGLTVPASASPHIVPVPYSVAANVDPEEAFVAALSSCHMLFFLALAARRRIVVDRYTDAASGYLEKDEEGRQAMTRVILRPAVSYAAGSVPARGKLERLHERAHGLCFIANSVRSEVCIEIVS